MFNLQSKYKPTGDQPQAIEYLSKGIKGSRKNIYNGKHNSKNTKTNINLGP